MSAETEREDVGQVARDALVRNAIGLGLFVGVSLLLAAAQHPRVELFLQEQVWRVKRWIRHDPQREHIAREVADFRRELADYDRPGARRDTPADTGRGMYGGLAK